MTHCQPPRDRELSPTALEQRAAALPQLWGQQSLLVPHGPGVLRLRATVGLAGWAPRETLLLLPRAHSCHPAERAPQAK